MCRAHLRNGRHHKHRLLQLRDAAWRPLESGVRFYCFNRSANFFLNLANFGATTAWQYGWLSLFAKYSW